MAIDRGGGGERRSDHRPDLQRVRLQVHGGGYPPRSPDGRAFGRSHLDRARRSALADGRREPARCPGLLCYTEFLGSFITGKTKGSSRRNFEAFFDRLGPCYARFARAHDAYEILRCGMVHEYAVKRDCTIYMRNGSVACGIGIDDNERYYFVVERYFEDFKRAARELHAELQARPLLPT
jgi:hypothetical protein